MMQYLLPLLEGLGASSGGLAGGAGLLNALGGGLGSMAGSTMGGGMQGPTQGSGLFGSLSGGGFNRMMKRPMDDKEAKETKAPQFISVQRANDYGASNGLARRI